LIDIDSHSRDCPFPGASAYYIFQEDAPCLSVLPVDIVGPLDTRIITGIVAKKLTKRDSYTGAELKLLRYGKWLGVDYYTYDQAAVFCSHPCFTSLTLSGPLFVSKKSGSMWCQTCMNLFKGIIVGAIN
jgi:hypothetical protein